MRLCQMYNGLISYICSMYEKNPEEETFKTFFLKYHVCWFYMPQVF